MSSQKFIKKSFMTAYIFLGLWYVFFRSATVLTPHYAVVWPAIVVAGFVFHIKPIYQLIKTNAGSVILMLFAFLIMCYISCFYSIEPSGSILYSNKIALSFLFALVLTCNREYYPIVVNMISLYIVILLIISFIQLVNTDFYHSYFMPLLSLQDSVLVKGAVQHQYAVGLTNGTSINGYYMIVGFILFLARFLTSDKWKIFNGVMIACFIGMLFATGKRNYSLCMVVIFLFLLNYVLRDKEKFVKYFKITLIILSLILLFQLISPHLPVLNNVFNKTRETFESGDVSNGRIDLYRKAIKEIKSNIFFGIGVDASVMSGVDSSVHNSYLQLFLEFGLIGGIIPFIALFYEPIKVLFKLRTAPIRKQTVEIVAVSVLILFLWSAFFANPVQWPEAMMLYMNFLIIAYNAVTDKMNP